MCKHGFFYVISEHVNIICRDRAGLARAIKHFHVY